MPTKIYKPASVVVSNGGEIKITLELNINLNSDGISASVVAKTTDEKEQDPFEFVIPEFTSVEGIEFGKQVSDV